MATYTKKLKTLNIYLMLDGETVTIADTADDDKATRALNEFKKYGSMHYETEEGGEKVTNEIPYHAVQYIEVTEADGSVERPDPYGCDEGGGGDTYTIIFNTGFIPEEVRIKLGETIITPVGFCNPPYVQCGWQFNSGHVGGSNEYTLTEEKLAIDFVNGVCTPTLKCCE